MAIIKGWRKVKPKITDPKTKHEWEHSSTRQRISIYTLRITSRTALNPAGITRRVHGKFIVASTNDGKLISGIAGQSISMAIKIARNYMRTHPNGIKGY